jgi:transforming growth factor-beta-induced protein
MKKQLLNLISKPNAYRIALVFVLAFVTLSCNKEDDLTSMQTSSESKDIAYVLENFSSVNSGVTEDDFLKKGTKVPTFKTLVAALVQEKLVSTIAKEELTIFAPSDEAFAALGLNESNIGTVPNLKEILLYHAVAGKVYSTMLTSKFVPTVNGAAVKIDVSSGVMVNDASVVKADIKAINGVIHIIDKVLIPPSKNLVETALANAPEFSILVEAVQKAKLVETLSTGGPFTVFAPTNAAFAALLAELKVSSLDALSEETVKNVLLYHVVSGRVFSSDLQAGPVNTLNGTFNVNLSNLKITDANMREAGLVPSLLNIQAKNGVIHVIDRVILPK